MNRRRLLTSAGTLLGLALEGSYLSRIGWAEARRDGTEAGADLVIVGGGTGGCAAALAACRNGLRVVMTEETDWIGGQLTAQAIPPDEHRYIERFGCTRSYREYRNRVRDYYRRNYPLTAEARA